VFLGVLAAGPAAGQEWSDAVEKANTHRRYAVRKAASDEVARAGDAAVPAIQAFVAARGRDAVDLLLVDAIAKADGRGPEVLALLRGWAEDRDFFWRAQALGALAARGLPDDAARFRTALGDPSHLFRIEGARGALAVGSDADRQAATELLADPDPRVRVRVAAALPEDRRALPVLAGALGREDDFLGDPWAARDADLAARALCDRLGLDFDAVWRGSAGEPEARAAAVARLSGEARAAYGEDGWPALPVPGGALPPGTGGVEIRSCRNGDLFVRWTPAGEVVFGLEGDLRVQLPAQRWQVLAAALASTPNGTLGRVVCDFVRLAPGRGAAQLKAAPLSLPAGQVDCLNDLAAAVDETGAAPRAAALLRDRLTQFAAVPK
jgi:hypothetical protein